MNNPEVNQKFCFLRPLLQIGSLMVEQSRLTISFGLVLSYSSQTQQKIDYTIMTTKSLLGKKYKLQLASRFPQFQGTQPYHVGVYSSLGTWLGSFVCRKELDLFLLMAHEMV